MDNNSHSYIHTICTGRPDRESGFASKKELDSHEFHALSRDLYVVTDSKTMDKIRLLRKKHYKSVYPTMDLDNDTLDEQGLILFSRDQTGEINSTARLTVDGEQTLPEEDFLHQYRQSGFRIMEWGRFIIVDGNLDLLKSYYEAVYVLGSRLGMDAVVMAMKPKDLSFHKRLLGIDIIEQDMGITYGGPHSLACVVWQLKKTKPFFFNWIRS